MSAEVLREAASLMRRRAERVSPGRYGFTSKWTTPTTMLTRIVRKGRVVAEARGSESLYDLDHLSYWHPAVTLAVADLLDTAGADLWAHGPLCCDDGCMDCDDDMWMPHVRRALAVARAYLGSAS